MLTDSRGRKLDVGYVVRWTGQFQSGISHYLNPQKWYKVTAIDPNGFSFKVETGSHGQRWFYFTEEFELSEGRKPMNKYDAHSIVILETMAPESETSDVLKKIQDYDLNEQTLESYRTVEISFMEHNSNDSSSQSYFAVDPVTGIRIVETAIKIIQERRKELGLDP